MGLVGLIADLTGSFAIGLAAPLTAVCVIPLYPGFIAYLSNTVDGTAPSVAYLGALVALGVISFMFLLGLVFTTVLEVALTSVIGIVSPVAFAALGVMSLLLLADVDFERLLPALDPPGSDRPTPAAFGYGFFFGAIIIPCNPGFVAVFFARSLLFTNPVANVLNFLAFGGGIATPLLALAVISDRWNQRILGWLTTHRTLVNRLTGAIMLVIALYYLIIVFDVLRIG